MEFRVSKPYYFSIAHYSVHITSSGLLGGLVGNHLLFEGNENLFHGSFRVPVLEKGEVRGNSSVLLVYTGNVDLRVEFDARGSHGVVRAALN